MIVRVIVGAGADVPMGLAMFWALPAGVAFHHRISRC